MAATCAGSWSIAPAAVPVLAAGSCRGALAFCDEQGLQETALWTFKGLDAARRLYEEFGFRLVEEHPGRRWGSPVLEQKFVRAHPATEWRRTRHGN